MPKEIILHRELTVKTWLFHGTVACIKKRDDIIIVLKHLNEFNETGAELLSEKLFFDKTSRVTVAKRLLHNSQLLGLTHESKGLYSLTKEGYQALESQEIFIPMQGNWKISMCNDPLITNHVVEISEHREPNLNLSHNNNERQDRNFSSLPEFILSLENTTIEVINSSEMVRFDEFDNKGERMESESRFRLEWNLREDTVEIYEGDSLLKTFKKLGYNYEEVIQSLLIAANLQEDWNQNTEKLKVNIEQLNNSERLSATKDISILTPSIYANSTQLNTFDSLTLENIQLEPENHNAAFRWFDWRLFNACDKVMTKEEFQQFSQEAYKPFQDFDLELPSLADYSHRKWREISFQDIDRTWNLIACSDWEL